MHYKRNSSGELRLSELELAATRKCTPLSFAGTSFHQNPVGRLQGLDILPAANGEDSYGVGCWSDLFGGFLPQPPLLRRRDNEEA